MEMLYLTTHSTHFIYGFMAYDIHIRTTEIKRRSPQLFWMNTKGCYRGTIPHTAGSRDSQQFYLVGRCDTTSRVYTRDGD